MNNGNVDAILLSVVVQQKKVRTKSENVSVRTFRGPP
jgi:hypothetical protein